MHQPSLKKVATDGKMGVMPMNSMQIDTQGTTGGYSTAAGGSGVGLSSMSRQLPGREVGGRVVKTSTVLSQSWKEDMDAGQMLASLFELFGESVLAFTPKPELSFFL